jgi:hypothetical protein
LFSRGYKEKELGSSNNTYTLWYNLVFLNLYFLFCKEIKEIQESETLAKENMLPPLDSIDSDFYADFISLKQKNTL